MKVSILFVLLVALSMSAALTFADNSATTTPATQTKISFKEAKAECLKQDSNLKGRALKACIHSKRKLASQK